MLNGNKNLGIKELAKLANVSIGTVDRVLHNRVGVSSKTKKRVLNIIEISGYKKNVMASRLKLASTKIIKIAILIPESKNESSYWRLPLQGVDTAVDELSQSGISAEYYFFDQLNPQTFSDGINRIFESEFHGLITIPLFEEESNRLLSQAKRKRVPVVFLDTERNLNSVGNYIRQNSFNAGKIAGRLLHGLIGVDAVYFVVNILNERETQINNYQLEKGFRAYFAKNTEKENIEIHIINYSIEGKLNLAPEIQKAFQTKIPKGIFVTNARSYMLPNILKANGIVNTRIVGFDLNEMNIQYLKSGEIDFLINQKPKHQGYSAVKSLFKYLTEDDDSGLNIDIPVEIVVKESLEYYENEQLGQ